MSSEQSVPLTSLDREETPLLSNTSSTFGKNTVSFAPDTPPSPHPTTGEPSKDAQPSLLFPQKNPTKKEHTDEFLGVGLYSKTNKSSDTQRGSASTRAPPVHKTQKLLRNNGSDDDNANNESSVNVNRPFDPKPSWYDMMCCFDRSQANVVVLQEVPSPPPTAETPVTVVSRESSQPSPAVVMVPAQSSLDSRPSLPPLRRTLSGINAITQIQRHWRGYHVRHVSTEQAAVAIRAFRKIQRQRRERRDAQRPTQRQSLLERAQQYYAAVIIQRHWQHYQTCRHRKIAKDERKEDSSKVATFASPIPLAPREGILNKLSPRLHEPLFRVLDKQTTRIHRRRSADDGPFGSPTLPPTYEVRRSFSDHDLMSLTDGVLSNSWGALTFSSFYSRATTRSGSHSVASSTPPGSHETSEQTHEEDTNVPNKKKNKIVPDRATARDDSEGDVSIESDGVPSPGSNQAYALPRALSSRLDKFLDHNKNEKLSSLSSVVSVEGDESKYTGETITSEPDGEDNLEIYLDKTIRTGASRSRSKASNPFKSSGTEQSLSDQAAYQNGDVSSDDSLSALHLQASYENLAEQGSEDSGHMSAQEYYGYGSYHESVPDLVEKLLVKEEQSLLNTDSPFPHKDFPIQQRSQSMPTAKEWADSLFGTPEGRGGAEPTPSEQRKGSTTEHPFDQSFVVATTAATQDNNAPDMSSAQTRDPKDYVGGLRQTYRQKISKFSPNRRNNQKIAPESTSTTPQAVAGSTKDSKQPSRRTSQTLELGPIHAAQTKTKVTHILRNMRERISPGKPARQDATSDTSGPTIEEDSGQASSTKMSVRKFLNKIPKSPSPLQSQTRSHVHAVDFASSVVGHSVNDGSKTQATTSFIEPKTGNLEGHPGCIFVEPSKRKSTKRRRSPLRALRSDGTSQFVGDRDIRKYVRKYVGATRSPVFARMKTRFDEMPSLESATSPETPSTPRSWPKPDTLYIHRTRPISLKDKSPISDFQSSATSPTSPLTATRLFASNPNFQTRRNSADECSRRVVTLKESNRRSSTSNHKSRSERSFRDSPPRIRRPWHWPNQSRRLAAMGKLDTVWRKDIPGESKEANVESVRNDALFQDYESQYSQGGAPMTSPPKATDKQDPVFAGRASPEIQSLPPASVSVPSIASVISTPTSPHASLEKDSGAGDIGVSPNPKTKDSSARSVLFALSIVGLAVMIYRAQQEQVPHSVTPRPAHCDQKLNDNANEASRRSYQTLPPLPILRYD